MNDDKTYNLCFLAIFSIVSLFLTAMISSCVLDETKLYYAHKDKCIEAKGNFKYNRCSFTKED